MSNLFTLENVLMYGVPVLFIGIAVIVLIAAVRLRSRAASAKNWPQTQGTVLSALIEKSDSDGTPCYRPIIAYQYQVNGKSYQCDHLAFGKQTGAKPDERGRLKAEEKARQYPVGRSVDVHYNARSANGGRGWIDRGSAGRGRHRRGLVAGRQLAHSTITFRSIYGQ
jgi:hypothetical protein